MSLYRGIVETEDPENPQLLTAAIHPTRREAVRAAVRTARAAGYEADKDSCAARLVEPGDDDDDEEED